MPTEEQQRIHSENLARINKATNDKVNAWMAYYTKYTIHIEAPEMLLSQIQSDIEKVSGYEFNWERANGEKVCARTSPTWNGGCGIKWYNHEKDILSVSELHPYAFISVSGVGEEEGDEWILFVTNGKTQIMSTYKTSRAICTLKRIWLPSQAVTGQTQKL